MTSRSAKQGEHRSIAHVPPERRWMRRREDLGPPEAWPQDGGTAPLPWVPDPRIPQDDGAAPRGWQPAPEPEPRRPWRRDRRVPPDPADRPRGIRQPRRTLSRRLGKLVVAAAVVPGVVCSTTGACPSSISTT